MKHNGNVRYEEGLWLTTFEYRKRYKFDWVEFPFRAKLINGYWITMAAVYLPKSDRLAIGASACSPDDVFSRPYSTDAAIGRARQVAIWFLTDRKFKAKDGTEVLWQERPTLLGTAGSSIVEFVPEVTQTESVDGTKPAFDVSVWKQAKIKAQSLENIVLRNAESVAIEHWFTFLETLFPDYKFDYIYEPRPTPQPKLKPKKQENKEDGNAA